MESLRADSNVRPTEDQAGKGRTANDPPRRMGAREAAASLDRVLHGFDRTCPDDLSGRLGLERHRLSGEGIRSLTFLRGRLLDDDELRKARNDEDAGFLQLFVADGCER